MQRDTSEKDSRDDWLAFILTSPIWIWYAIIWVFLAPIWLVIFGVMGVGKWFLALGGEDKRATRFREPCESAKQQL